MKELTSAQVEFISEFMKYDCDKVRPYWGPNGRICTDTDDVLATRIFRMLDVLPTSPGIGKEYRLHPLHYLINDPRFAEQARQVPVRTIG